MTQAKILVGKKTAAESLDLCQRTVDYLVAEGELPVVRVGRRILFFVADLEAFARKRSHRTGRGMADGMANGGAAATQGGL
ncbi:MAG: helix-turn-helix domain-containing protein [Terriglobia bacterium]